jgi:hypothetical protein
MWTDPAANQTRRFMPSAGERPCGVRAFDILR